MSLRVCRTKQSFTLFKDYFVTRVMTPDNFWGPFGLFWCDHATRSGQMVTPLKSWNGKKILIKGYTTVFSKI